LPDVGFLRQICKILADLKVIWRAKNISGGLPISDGFLADLTNFAWRILADFYIRSGGFEKIIWQRCPTLASLHPVLVLLRIPDFRDRDFRILKPILKNGFESDPDL
jgi:hypothetical protein